MKSYFLPILLALCAASSFAQLPLTEKEAVDYAKSLDVKTLDPTLPSQRLEEWLRSGPPHLVKLQWMLYDTCQLHADSSSSDYPSCVRIEFERGGQEGSFLVLIGTLKKGIIGKPQLYSEIYVVEPGFVLTGNADQLSGLPSLLDQPAVTGSVSDLYQKVAERHPIGIPQGADKTALWPLFSRRLALQLEIAQACQDDYFRRQSQADTNSKPEWTKKDLFSGEDDQAALFFANIVHKEPLKDGSFAVQLNVVERNGTGKNSSIIAGGIRAYAVKRDWAAIATVVPENNRFVVDDIRIFEENSTDGPSHLLSETFAGCDGPHWTGKHVEPTPIAAVAAAAPPPPVDWDAVNLLRSAAYEEELTFGKAIDVHQLDPSLPSQRLDNWLQSGPLHVRDAQWNPGNCNIKEGNDGAQRNPEGGLCATVWFRVGNARVSIQVGKSASDPPRVKHIGVADKNEDVLAPLINKEKPSDSDRLSDLSRLVAEESVIDVVRILYDLVVANHPRGVPLGKDKARLTPLLSKRLKQQLEAASACQADYYSQPVAGRNSQPAWLDAGLFSGEGVLALPRAAFADHKERQSDDSFLVFVWLSRKMSVKPAADPVTPLWKIWHVSVRVISEAGRFVVDDVQLSDNDSSDGASRLLSNSFNGCDGPKWVGVSAGAK